MLDIVDSIPPASVMTYGDVAAVLGSHAARAVGRVMATSGREVAWWRVIRASGEPPIGHELAARAHYEAEGTPLDERADGSYRVRLRLARHTP